jgi:hypothetical protein
MMWQLQWQYQRLLAYWRLIIGWKVHPLPEGKACDGSHTSGAERRTKISAHLTNYKEPRKQHQSSAGKDRMSDIVKRLRAYAENTEIHSEVGPTEICLDAADEIERLRRECGRWNVLGVVEMETEIERLRAIIALHEKRKAGIGGVLFDRTGVNQTQKKAAPSGEPDSAA